MATPRSRPASFYIVGLPEEGVESDRARLKFERLSKELTRSFPHIEEIRAVVKSKTPTKPRALFEVSVEVYTPRERHSFKGTAYDLASAFDAVGPKVKKMLASKPSKVTSMRGHSRRKQAG